MALESLIMVRLCGLKFCSMFVSDQGGLRCSANKVRDSKPYV